jgi:NADH dehydrogenase
MAEPSQLVLVTGATGFVGREVVRRLRNDGFLVRALVRPQSVGPAGDDPGLRTVASDVTRPEGLADAARGCDAAVHLVGILRETPDQTYEAVHERGTANLAAACVAAGVRRIIHVSALGAGRGIDTGYFRSKDAAEATIRESGLDWTILRPAIIHGPQGGFMVQMARMVAHPGPVPLIGRGLQVLQPVWVEDVAAACAAALARPATVGRTVDLGGPDILTLRGFYRRLCLAVLGREKMLVSVPEFVVRMGASVAGAMLTNPPVTPDEITMLDAARPCDIEPMKEAFGVDPAPFEPTLQSYAPALCRAAGLDAPSTDAPED